MIRHQAAMIIVALAVTAPAQAFIDETPSGQPAPSEATEAEPEDKIICRSRGEARTGSNLRPGRECRKASEWKEREIVAKRELQRFRDRYQSPGMGEGR
jgi:hypothetical protein